MYSCSRCTVHLRVRSRSGNYSARCTLARMLSLPAQFHCAHEPIVATTTTLLRPMPSVWEVTGRANRRCHLNTPPPLGINGLVGSLRARVICTSREARIARATHWPDRVETMPLCKMHRMGSTYEARQVLQIRCSLEILQSRANCDDQQSQQLPT